MSSLTLEEEKQYTGLVDEILAKSDLETVSRKKVRQALEDAVGQDLSHQKDPIKRLIEIRFDILQNPPVSDTDAETNGQAQETPSDEAEDEPQETQPPKKKRKRSVSDDEDARLAAELQAEENKLARARPTRGGQGSGKGKPKPKPKTKPKTKPKKKSEKRARESGDEGSGSEAESDKKKASGGFRKVFALSPALQDVVGAPELSRPQVVKKIWEYIRAHDRQDPSDRRQILCDEKLQRIFRTNRVSMFAMNKCLGDHLYAPEEIQVGS